MKFITIQNVIDYKKQMTYKKKRSKDKILVIIKCLFVENQIEKLTSKKWSKI